LPLRGDQLRGRGRAGDDRHLSLHRLSDADRNGVPGAVLAPAEHFVLKGEPTISVKIAESGRKRSHAFCPTCDSPIYAAAPENPTAYGLRVGLIRQRKELRPRKAIWCVSALPWSTDLEALALESHDRQPSRAGPPRQRCRRSEGYIHNFD